MPDYLDHIHIPVKKLQGSQVRFTQPRLHLDTVIKLAPGQIEVAKDGPEAGLLGLTGKGVDASIHATLEAAVDEDGERAVVFFHVAKDLEVTGESRRDINLKEGCVRGEMGGREMVTKLRGGGGHEKGGQEGKWEKCEEVEGVRGERGVGEGVGARKGRPGRELGEG